METQLKYPCHRFLDTVGESCPMPLILAQNELITMGIGDRLCIATDDAGALTDFKSWVVVNNQNLETWYQENGVFYIYIVKKSRMMLE